MIPNVAITNHSNSKSDQSYQSSHFGKILRWFVKKK